MATSGPRYPGTAASLANSGTSENANAWNNPGNVSAADGTEAQITAATFDSPDISEILVASNFNFAADIPAGSYIDGITVEVHKRGFTSSNSGKDYRVQLATGTAFANLVGSNKATTDVWPQTTLATTTYGGSADTWSAGLTAAQVRATGFAVFVSAYANVANADIAIDYIRVTITYSPPQDITLGLIDAGPALYAPTVIPDKFVTLPLLVAVPGEPVRSTQVVADDFSGSSGSSWPNADTGGAYTPNYITNRTTMATYSEGAGIAAMTAAAGQSQGGSEVLVDDISETDIELQVLVGHGQVENQGCEIYARVMSAGAYYKVVVRYLSGTSEAYLATPQAQIGTTIINLGSTATLFWVLFQCSGDRLRVKVWESGANQPSNWQIDETDTSTPGPGAVGLGGWDVDETGLSFDDFAGYQLTSGTPIALFAPTVEGLPPSGPQTLTLALLDAGPALYAPTVVPDQLLTVPLLDGAPALYAPTLTPTNLLTPPLLDGAPALYAPVVAAQAVTLTVPLLDAAPALYAPVLASLKTVALPLLAALAGYPPDTTLTAAGHPTLNSDTRPGYLATIVDSTWNTRITRVSDTHLWRNQYSTAQSWNADGSRIMFPGYGGRILHGETYADLGAMAQWADMVHWSNINPDHAFGTKYWDNRVRRWSASTNSWSDLHTFSSWGSLDFGNYSGNVSDNDRIALAYCTTTDHDTGTWGIVVYDCANDTVISTLELGAGSAYWPGGVIISRSGNYVIVYHPTSGSGANQGTKLYNASDMSYVRHITNGRPHSDAGRNAAGEDIFVFISDSTDPEGGNHVRSHRLYDGYEFSIFANSQIYGIGHISCANYERPGWVYLNSNNITLPTVDGFQQVIAAKTDGSETVEVFAFHHGTASPEQVDLTITAISQANPTVITVPTGHGQLGQTTFGITISGSNSTPSVDGTHTATVVDATHFTVPVNVTVAGTTGTGPVWFYDHTPLASVDRRGERVIWGSPWGAALGNVPDGNTFAYVAYASVGGAVVFPPTLIPAPLGVSLPLLDAVPDLYAPVVSQPAGATQSITIPLLDAEPALYAPTVLPQPVTVTLGLLDGAPALYAPAVQPKNLLTPPLLDAAPAVYAPTIVATNTLTPPLLDSGPALYAPTLLPQPVTVTLGLLDAGAALYAPVVAAAPLGVFPPLLDAGPDLYAPTLLPQPVTVSLGLLDAAGALYAPTLVPAPLGVSLPLLDAVAALYAPTIIPAQLVTPPLLDGAPALYAPSLAHSLTAPFLDAVAALYAPTLLPGPVTVIVPFLDGVAELYDPTLAIGGAISVPFLDAGAALYQPVLAAGPVSISVGFIDAGGDLYPPTVQPAPVVMVLTLLDGAPALYAPTLGKLNTIPLAFLDASAALYQPVISPGAVSIGLGLLDAARALYELYLSQGVKQTVFMAHHQGATLTSGATMTQKTPKMGSE